MNSGAQTIVMSPLKGNVEKEFNKMKSLKVSNSIEL